MTPVHVRHDARGAWEVVLPGAPRACRIGCETLAEAERVGCRWASAHPPSELIVHDAYHRVVLRRSFRVS